MSLPKRSNLTTTAASTDQHSSILPGLPDHLAQLSLSSLSPSLLFSVSRTWRRLLYSSSFPPHLSLYFLLSDPNPDSPNPLRLSSFDPISSSWAHLPPPPLPDLILTHPSYISRQFPVQSAASADKLVLVAATGNRLSPAMSTPLVFDPLTQTWNVGPPYTFPRRWCAVGSDNGCLYIASGVGSEYSSDVARSFEKWDMKRAGSGWEGLGPLRYGKFSREAIEMVASNGKLCMVNVRGKGVKEGVMYDLGLGRWVEMPNGLLKGWNGPAAVVGGVVYGVDETRGVLRRYGWAKDVWTVVIEDDRLKGAVGIAGGGGRVCVACGGGEVVVVDVVSGGGVWTVAIPERSTVVGMHVLPRVARSEC